MLFAFDSSLLACYFEERLGSGMILMRRSGVRSRLNDANRNELRRFVMAAKHLSTLIALVSLVFLPRIASAQSAVSFDNEQTLVVVNVLIDGHSKRLLFDTGSQRTIVYGHQPRAERSVPVAIGGKSRIVPIIFMDLAAMSRNVVVAMQTVNADGILGQDFLRQFASVHIDYKTQTIILD